MLFLIFVFISESLISSNITQGINKFLVILGLLFLIVLIPTFIFDRFVPSECPKCKGKMYGGGDAFRFGRKCKNCEY